MAANDIPKDQRPIWQNGEPMLSNGVDGLQHDPLKLDAASINPLASIVALTVNSSAVIGVNDSNPVITVLNNSTTGQGVFESKLIIPLYVIIFLLAVVGNSLVLVTLVQNKRMRTVTNVYLLNLVSFSIEVCMPQC